MFTGIYAPIATPFLADEINYDALKSNLQRYSRTRLSGLVVLGSNGEFALMDMEEKMSLIEFVRQHTAADKRIIAGVGCESTRDTIRLSRYAASAGADAALVLAPNYYKGSMTDTALEHFFLDVADASNIPVMLYNMPRNTGINMSTSLVAKLAAHENIAGVKDSSGNIVQIAEIIASTPDDFSVFAGSGSYLYATLALGGAGGTLAVANIMPDCCVQLYDAVRSGHHADAVALQQTLLAPNAAVTSRWGIAGLKAAMNLLGYHGGETRRPLMPLDEHSLTELKQILQAADALA